MDYVRRFGGIARLYGEAGLARIAAAHVVVIGIGGVGSWVAEALARSALGEITLIDLDNLAESNINRQLHALEQTLGMAKVDAMRERIAGINPDCRVHTVEEFITPDNLDSLIGVDVDHVIDCVDSYRVKAALIAYCRRRRIRVVSVGGAGGQIDPLKIRLADLSRTEHDPLLSKTRKLLRREYHFPTNPKRRFEVPSVYSVEQPRFPDTKGGVCMQKGEGDRGSGLNCGGYGSVTSVTATFGFVAVSHVLRKLSGVSG